MHIAILGIKSLPAFAGADRVVEKLLEHYDDTNDYTVYLLSGGAEQMPDRKNVRYIYLPALRGKHLRAFSFFFLCALHALLFGKYDLAHVHNSDFGLFCLLLRLRRKLRIIGTFHGNPYERKKWGGWARSFLLLSEKLFISSCHALTTVALSKVDEVPASARRRIRYIPNGIDPVPGLPGGATPDYAALGIERGEYLLFACGRLDATKGLHHLLQVYLQGDFAEKLLVVGDFSHDPEYSESVCNAARQSSGIILLKRLLAKDELLDLVRNCKVFVFPSEIEAMSMMLLEVISCSKLVVCSDIRENVEVVGEDYAYLFSLDRPGDLREKLVTALQDADAAHLMERVQATCMERFNWNTLATDYLTLYATCMEERP